MPCIPTNLVEYSDTIQDMIKKMMYKLRCDAKFVKDPPPMSVPPTNPHRE